MGAIVHAPPNMALVNEVHHHHHHHHHHYEEQQQHIGGRRGSDDIQLSFNSVLIIA